MHSLRHDFGNLAFAAANPKNGHHFPDMLEPWGASPQRAANRRIKLLAGPGATRYEPPQPVTDIDGVRA